MLGQVPDEQSGTGVKFVLYLATLASVLCAMTVVAYQLWGEAVQTTAQEAVVAPIDRGTDSQVNTQSAVSFSTPEEQREVPVAVPIRRTLQMVFGRAAIEFEVMSLPREATDGSGPGGGNGEIAEFQKALLRREELSRLSHESFEELADSSEGRLILEKIGRLFWYGKKLQRHASLQALLPYLHSSVRSALTENPNLNPGER